MGIKGIRKQTTKRWNFNKAWRIPIIWLIATPMVYYFSPELIKEEAVGFMGVALAAFIALAAAIQSSADNANNAAVHATAEKLRDLRFRYFVDIADTLSQSQAMLAHIRNIREVLSTNPIDRPRVIIDIEKISGTYAISYLKDTGLDDDDFKRYVEYSLRTSHPAIENTLIRTKLLLEVLENPKVKSELNEELKVLTELRLKFINCYPGVEDYSVDEMKLEYDCFKRKIDRIMHLLYEELGNTYTRLSSENR